LQENKVKAIWMDKAFELNDSVLFEALSSGTLKFFDQLNLPTMKKFISCELFYSIAPELNKSLSLLIEKALLNFGS